MMNMNENLEAAIKSRHSVRSYTDQAIEPDKATALRDLIAEANRRCGLRMTLVTDEPDAFGKSKLAHYGKFTNVRNYVCLIGPSGDDVAETLGHEGERIVLHAQELGLNSCWVGLTVSKKVIPVEVPEGDKIHAVIALGYGTTQGPAHKSKSPEKVAKNYAEAPDWFRRGVDFALLAPTALNQQKFKFEWLGDNRVKATKGFGFFTSMDLGIAKLHFEIGADRVVDYR